MHRKFRPYSFHMRFLRGSRTSPMAGGGGGGGGGGDEGGGDGGKGKEVPAYVKFTEKLSSPFAYLALTLPLLSPLEFPLSHSLALAHLPSQSLALSFARPLVRSPSHSLALSCARPLTPSTSHSLAPLSFARAPLTRSRPSHSLARLSLARNPLTHSRPLPALSLPPAPLALLSPLALVTTLSPSLPLSLTLVAPRSLSSPLAHSRRPSLTLVAPRSLSPPHAHSSPISPARLHSPFIPFSHFLAPSCPVD
ncbi:unnamed protein product [Closterium sp. Naga37s-1]|nr:unnamed protein product [Closterium sp. Naga37s-1]